MSLLDKMLIRYGKFKIKHSHSPTRVVGMWTEVLFGSKIVKYNVLEGKWRIYNNRR